MTRLLIALLLALTMTGSAARAATPVATPVAHPEFLVDAAWVRDHLADPAVRFVALMPADVFARGHIPGSVNVDWPDLELTASDEATVAAWQERMTALLTSLGITPETTVVAYDGGTLYSARVWWVLDALGHADKRLLDGGLLSWIAAGESLATDTPAPPPAAEPYLATPNPDALTTLDEVIAGLEDPAVLRIDARPDDAYRAGHLPGAISLPYTLTAIEGDMPRFKSADDLEALFAAAGVTRDRMIVPYCRTGVQSAVIYFTLRLLGHERVSLFSGSWAEWSAHPELPVEVVTPTP